MMNAERKCYQTFFFDKSGDSVLDLKQCVLLLSNKL